MAIWPRGVRQLWRDDRRFRLTLLVVDAGLIAFWVYSVIYIMDHPAEKGSDGFEILAAVPMTGIALFLSFPALLLLIWKRTLRIGAWVTLAAIVMNVWCWTYILLYAGLGRYWV